MTNKTQTTRQHRIFKQSSTTYYYSSLAFPQQIREDITALYGFVRTADNFLDTIPQQEERFYSFKQQTKDAFGGKTTENPIIDDFVDLCLQKNIQQKWVDAFLNSMEMDLEKQTYTNLDELKTYMYGSAEVIGLMISRILDLDEDAHKTAKLQGRAMQYINFLRDIDEDNTLGRQYLPQTILDEYNLNDCSETEARNNKQEFTTMMRSEIKRYRKWQNKAYEGYGHLPFRTKIPIATAARLYDWTADRIHKNPLTVYKTKIKPSKLRVAKEMIGAIL